MHSNDEKDQSLVENAEPLAHQQPVSADDISMESEESQSDHISKGSRVVSEPGTGRNDTVMSNGVNGVNNNGYVQSNGVSDMRQVTSVPEHHVPVVMYTSQGERVVVAAGRQSIQSANPIKPSAISKYFFFSVVAIILFFPTGIPALVYAHRTKQEFLKQTSPGASAQTWKKARKYAKTCTNMIIFSFVLFLTSLAIGVAIFEHHYYKGDDEYWSNRHNNVFG